MLPRIYIGKRTNADEDNIFELVEKGDYRAVLRHLAAKPGDIEETDEVNNIINGASASRQKLHNH